MVFVARVDYHDDMITIIPNNDSTITVQQGKIDLRIFIPKDEGSIRRYRQDAEKIIEEIQKEYSLDAWGLDIMLFFIAEELFSGND